MKAKMLLIVLLTLCSFLTQAADYTCITNNGAITITKYTGSGGAVTIPSAINGLPVTIIEEQAFAGNSGLTSVTVPSSVTLIRVWAFGDCNNLTRVTVASQNIIIASYAFTTCRALTGVYFAGNAPSVGENLFFNNTVATIYYMPGTTGWTNTLAGRPTGTWLTLNGGTASPPYTDLQHVAISANTPPAGKVFYQWTGAAQYVASVTSSTTTVSMPTASITLTATYGDPRYRLTVVNGTGDGLYTNQQNVSIAADVPPGGVFFDRWTGDTQYVASATAPNTTFTMPARDSTVTAMYRSDFVCTTNNGKLTVTGYTGTGGPITIPESLNDLPVVSIAGDAFLYSKNSLTGVTIPYSVTNIGSGAFSGCQNLAGIQVNASNAFFSSTNGVLFNKNQTLLLQCPGTKSGNYVIPDTVGSIGTAAFLSCTNLTDVTIPPGVAAIGTGAFQNCKGLTNLVIGSGVTTVGDNAFYGCNAATNLLIPAGVTNIGVSAFGNCYGLTQVTVGSGVRSIGTYAFSYCTSLTKVLVPASVTSLGAYAFSPCTALTGIYFAGDAPSAGPDVFHQDSSATVYYMPGTTEWTNSFVSRPTAPWLTLTGGTAQGPHTNLQQVAISADIQTGKSFYRWTGATQYVAGVASSPTTVSMPLQAIALTAEYQTVYYDLTVQNGSGSGSYAYQQQVVITADAPSAGWLFDRWTGATQYVSDVHSASTTVMMPAQDAVLTATYKIAYYTLTVSSGSGSGEYTNQQQVVITAAEPSPGYAFDRWTGDAQYVANVASSAATVTMPAQDIAVTATYRSSVMTDPFDGFEEATLNPFWVAALQNGTISPSSARAHSGTQSAQFSAPWGGQKYLHLSHFFDVEQWGAVTVWVYDSLEYIYFSVNLENSLTGTTPVSINVQDWDTGTYYYNCSMTNYVGGKSSVPRAAGWREFTLRSFENELVLMVDGQELYRGAGTGPFDTIKLSVSGPGGGTIYFDSFSFTTNQNKDCDTDGVPDWWEQQYFGGSTNASPDAVCSNGVNTVRAAYIAGLNPNDPQSRLLISDFRSLTYGKVLGWTAVSGRVYSVYWTTNLMTEFECMESNIPWTQGYFTNSAAAPCGYYKIDVRMEE